MPQSAHLVKQHSHPLLPSQMQPVVVQRQVPQYRHRFSKSFHPHTSLDSVHLNSGSYSMDTGSRATPPSIRVVAAPVEVGGGNEQQQQSPLLLMAPEEGTRMLSLPSHLAAGKKDSQADQQGGGTTSTPTPPMLIVSGPGTGSLDYVPALRIKDELQRSISTPQVSWRYNSDIPECPNDKIALLKQVPTREFSLDNPRSSHCPAIRPGPALGCNFCWNTIDNHGRILRRKTKYHCPECQTNLCIVPCFQEYHERQASESTSVTSAQTPVTTAAVTVSVTGGNCSTSSCSATTGVGLSRGTSLSRVEKGSEVHVGKPPLKLALSSASTSSSSPSVDSAGSETAKQPPDFIRDESLQ